MSDAQERCKLTPEQTRTICDPAQFAFATTDTLPEPQEMPGQRRAQGAIAFALEMGDEGYHLYISGEPGTGRLTAALKAVRAQAEKQSAAADWCYVYNFDQPSEPRAISLPAGGGPVFARQVEDFVRACRRELRRAFHSDAYRQQSVELLKDISARQNRIMEQLQREAIAHGFAVQATPGGIMMVAIKPTPEGEPPAGRVDQLEPLSPQDFAALPEAEKERIRAGRDLVGERVARAMPSLEALQEEAGVRVHELDLSVAHQAVGRLTELLIGRYASQPRVIDYLRRLEDDIVAHADVLAARAEDSANVERERERAAPDQASAQQAGGAAGDESEESEEPRDANEQPDEEIHERPAIAALLRRYGVNALVTHRASEHAPVVQELNPTYPNLLGRVEFGLRMDLPFTDHLMIKAGALHRANGGFLVLQALDLLRHPGSWDAVKRALRFGVIGIESDGEVQAMPASASLRPEPIPVRLKLILIGQPAIFDALMALDSEFPELFTVRADFESDVPRTPEVERFYAEFTGFVTRGAGTPGLAPDAVALLVEEGSRWVGDQQRLSARLRGLQHLILEASRLAQRERAPITTRAHVARSLTARTQRISFVSDRLDELIDQRTIMIDTTGAVVGQVNGLTIMAAASDAFGKPARITARTAPGLAGIVNLEREIAMSGPAHAKGILILSGYLAGRFARDYPLSLAGSICFEQVYGEIEGDSASSAELYALLSSLSELPIKQSIAVTGSVNQRGEVQPVGMVTEKIEGFYDVCRRRGLTGEHGVIIPSANVHSLMLREDVVEAIRAGQFHVYAVSTIDEGIELLTGVPAGREGADGAFPDGTVNQRIGQTLREFSERMRGFPTGPIAPTHGWASVDAGAATRNSQP